MTSKAQCRLLLVAAVLASVMLAPSAFAQTADGVNQRDNTRAGGIVYDSHGAPLPKVEMWIVNHNSPADRMRGRTRGTGGFLVRGIGRLYTERDMGGIALRLTFELDGYETMEVVTPVQRNAYAEIYPILAKTGEDTSGMGWCLLLRGRVTNPKGKGIRDAVVTVTGADSDLRVETVTEKDGSYEALLWNAPSQLTVTATTSGSEQTEQLDLAGDPVTDQVALISQDFVF